MTKKTAIISAIAIAVLALGAIFAIGQMGRVDGRGNGGPGMGHGGRGHGPGAGMAFRALNLTDEQKTQVKQITDASGEKMKPVHEAMAANRDKLRELTKSGAFDEAQVTELANQQGALHAQMIVERHRTQAQVFQLLTDEQKAKAAELKDKMKDGFGRGKGRHGRSGDFGQAPNAEF